MVLLGGEPGSGKSRLVREFAAEAAADGALVLYGACDAVVRTPYGPFVEALDQLARGHRARRAARRARRRRAASSTRLLPDLPARVGGLPAPVEADPDTERHRLHTAVTDLLDRASAGAGRCCSCSRTATGPTRRRCCCCATWRAAPASARLLLLATFRDTEADVPAALAETLADLRRSDDVVRLRLAGLSGEEVAEFVRRAAGGELGAGPPELAQRDQRPDRAATRSWSASCGARWSRPGSSRSSTARSGSTAPAGRARHARRACARSSASGSPASRPATTDLLELAATAGAGVRARRPAPRRRPRRARAARRARRGRAQRHDRGAPVARRSPTGSPTSSCAARSTTGSPALRRAELHLRVGEALRGAAARSRPRARRPRPPLRRRRAVRRRRARRRVQPARRAGGDRRARLRRGRGAAAHRARAAGSRARPSAPRSASSSGPPATAAGKALDALEAFATAAEIARELGDARAARARGDRLRGRLLAARDRRRGRGRAARGGGRGARRRELGAARRAARRARPRARLPGRPRARGGRARRARSRWPAQLGDRAGLATVLMRSYWSRGTSSLEEILDDAHRGAGHRRASSATPRSAPRRWPGACRRSSRSATSTSARREVAALRETAEQTAQPFMLHVAEHYGSAIALCDGRLEEAEARRARSHEWSRLLTGRDASGVLRDPDVQHPARAGAAGRARAGGPDPRRRRAREGPWRPGLVVAARRARDGGARRGASSRGVARRRARRRSASRSGSPRSPT